MDGTHFTLPADAGGGESLSTQTDGSLQLTGAVSVAEELAPLSEAGLSLASSLGQTDPAPAEDGDVSLVSSTETSDSLSTVVDYGLVLSANETADAFGALLDTSLPMSTSIITSDLYTTVVDLLDIAQPAAYFLQLEGGNGYLTLEGGGRIIVY